MAEYSKAGELARWRRLPETVNPLEHMTPIPYQTRGSRYGACGIRIDGAPEFIDAVLGRLKGLLAGESTTTRLELSRHAVDTAAYENAAPDAEVCYIRLHARGSRRSRW